MKPGIVQRIFNDHFSAVDAMHPLDDRSRRAAWNIRTCRTPKQGFHIDECPNGDYRAILSNSCKHRACPMCGATETELWLERQCAKELRCKHHQIVFTSSDKLRPLWRWNRKLFTNLYFRAAWHALRQLLADTVWLGALPGVTAVFQSWSDELGEHLHLHFIVTSGGLSPDGKWIEADPEMLIPFPVLASLFRGKLIAYLREALNPLTARGKEKPKEEVLVLPPGMTVQQFHNLLNKLERQKWNVRVDPAYEQAGGVLKYVGRYIRRGPLSERRIRAYNGKQLTIAYAHPEKHSHRTFTLDAKEFILRLLSHAPEKGTHCARVYGLYHSAKREQLNQARAHFGQAPYEPITEPPDVHELLHRMMPDFEGDLCPKCHARLVTVFVIRHNRSPPMETAA
ncbi:MAG TPA: transposase [Tichowtungia sp.]|nr:transposase [Tichowtungia sp.]